MSHIIKDANGNNQTFKSTEDQGESVPHVNVDNLPPNAATATAQATANQALADILAKIIAAPATAANQDTIIAALSTLLSHTDGLEALLTAIQNKIIAAPATEAKQDNVIAELIAIRNKIIAAPATEAKQDNAITRLTEIRDKIIAAPSTEAKQDALIALITALIKAEDDAHATGHTGLMLLGVRRDTDGADGADGDYVALHVNSLGRLKVSALPGIYDLVQGNITGNGQTVFCDCSRASNVMVHMVATGLSGHNVTFEGSIDSTNGTDGAWFGIQAVRSNANTIETATGALAATPAYGWELSVNGLAFVRVRATAHTGGTANWKFQRAPYATEPIPAAQISGTQPVSGTVTVTSTTANFGTNGMSAFADSSTNLGAGATFTGTSRDGGATQAFARFVARAFADQAGTFRIEQSADNTTWRRATPDTAVAANAAVELAVFATARYHRLIFINGGVAQTQFLINSAYLRI